MRVEIQREIEIIVETTVVPGRFVDLDNPATLVLKAEGQRQSREQKEPQSAERKLGLLKASSSVDGWRGPRKHLCVDLGS